MRSSRTGQESCIVEYHWTGIIIIKQWICQCLDIANALRKFQHKQQERPQHAPYPARTPQYGSKIQLIPAVLDSPTLTPQGRKRIQQVARELLYNHDGHQQPRLATRNSNGRHRRKTHSTPQLLRNPPQRDKPLPLQRHDPEYPLRCWVPERTRSTKHSRRTFIYELRTNKCRTTASWVDTHLIENPPHGGG
jgi:hypothetical protein